MALWDTPSRHIVENLSDDERNAFLESFGQDWERLIRKRLLWTQLETKQTEFRNLAPTGGNDAQAGRVFLDTFLTNLHAKSDSIPDAARFARVLRDRVRSIPFSEIWLDTTSLLLIDLKRSAPNPISTSIDWNILADLGSDLISRLAELTEKLLWNEFNKQRTPAELARYHFTTEQKRKESSNSSYTRFVGAMKDGGVTRLTDEYPVLADFLETLLVNWTESANELISRLWCDIDEIRSVFSIPKSLAVVGIKLSQGDHHLGLRTVAIIEFGSENTDQLRRIVYRPRSVALEKKYNEVIRQYVDIPGTTPLPTIEVLDRITHGYTAYCNRQVLADEERATFYFQSGRLLAVLFILGCSDCHFENLIATRNGLCLIDPETLFEARPKDHVGEASHFVLPPSDTRKLIDESVLRTGLVPYWIFEGERSRAIDISALGVDVPNGEAQEVLSWLFVNTDGMVPGYLSNPVTIPNSLPYTFGQTNLLNKYVEDLCTGFRAQLYQIAMNRDQWTGPSGIASQFEGLNKRVVHRATRVYESLRRGMFEPSRMKSRTLLSAHLEKLARAYLLADHKPDNFCLLYSEISQMQCLDIPFFSSSIGALDIVVPGRTDNLEGYFDDDGLRSCVRRINSIDGDFIDFQVSLVKGAIQSRGLSLNSAAFGTSRERLERARNPSHISDRRHPLTELERKSAGLAIADDLVKASMLGPDGQREWIGIDIARDLEKFSFGTIGASLYSGSLGVALFLASAEGKYHSIASDVVVSIVRLFLNTSSEQLERWLREQPSGLLGVGGVLVALHELRSLLPGLCEEIEGAQGRIIDLLCDQEASSRSAVDVLGGYSGLIGPLLSSGSQRALKLAGQLGNILVSQQNEDGSWSYFGGSSPLTGFSHGAAGVSSALGALSVRTESDFFRASALKGLSFEREKYNESERNWPDLRFSTEGKSFFCGWCNGAPGIALSRLILKRVGFRDSGLDEEIESALWTTAHDVCFMDHVCCGRFGRSVILREFGAFQEAEELERRVILHSSGLEPKYALAASSEGMVAVPGLFNGLSGIGMALLAPTRLIRIMSAGLI